MVAVVPAGDVAIRLLAERGVPAWVAGGIESGAGKARLTGSHPDA
jgi:phosphoribosylformylglycinamidine cyclo-ligase